MVVRIGMMIDRMPMTWGLVAVMVMRHKPVSLNQNQAQEHLPGGGSLQEHYVTRRPSGAKGLSLLGVPCGRQLV